MWNKIKGNFKKPSFWLNTVFYLFAIYLILNSVNKMDTKPTGEISYSQYIENVKNKNIERIVASNYSSDLLVYTKEPIKTIQYERAVVQNQKFESNDNLTLIEKFKKKIGYYPKKEQIEDLQKKYYEKSYTVLAPKSVVDLYEKPNLDNIKVEVITLSWFWQLVGAILSLVPTLIMFAFIFWMFTKMSENSGILGSHKNSINEKRPNVKLSDVVGIEEDLKLEITEIIDFIKNPEKFAKLNAKSPKGILMVGEPGVGKTMLAKAIANEAGVDFFYRSASDLENPYVGMSAKTIKNLFEEARMSDNAIIFIDEIDAIGSRSGSQRSGKVKADTGLINALLTEMDGFEENENIVVIAATNHAEDLDPALLREGRFDRKIAIPLPNIKGRKEILEFYTKDKKMAEDVNLEVLARLTTEYSGAALAGIVNEASIQAVRENSEMITQDHLMKARDKKIMGIPFKNFEQSEYQRKLVAYHEAGHAILSYYLDKSHELYKVSILPRTGSLGVTVSVPLQENLLYNKTELENRIQILLGGRIAEEIFFNEVTTGASNDIERATNIADRMVKEWGMSSLGMINLNINTSGNAYNKNNSEKLLETADEQKQNIIKQNYGKAKQLISEKREELIRVAEALIEYEEIDFDLIVKLIKGEVKPPESVLKNNGFFIFNKINRFNPFSNSDNSK